MCELYKLRGKGKLRRLWRLAVATQPPIAYRQSASCPEGTRIRQKPTASSEGAQLAVGVRDGDENKQNQVYGLLTRSFL